jgi:DNA polymerase elongation subunit (family B)
LRGRIVIALDRLFERVYRDSKSTNLPSNKLDIVGQKLFGRGKTEFRPDFYDQDYHKFLNDYLYYNFRDVQLMVDIEDKYNLVNGQMALQRLAKCKFDSTFYGSYYARVYFMRKANFKQKTGHYGGSADDAGLKGAIVLDPEELDSVGLHKNVAILDFAGLYPSCMIAANCSFETKVKPGDEELDDIIGDGCRFRRSPMGILPASVIELDELRDDYKARRDAAGEKHGKTSNGFRKWDDAQKTVKRLRATFYGLMALKGFSWGDMDIARTITKFGRDSLMAIMRASEELGYKVIYGHTDFIFVKMGDDLSTEECVEQAKALGDYLTKMMQKDLKSDAMIVDCEMLMDRFYLPRRNRYGGRVVWMPEVGFKVAEEAVEDRMKIQGLEAKHANTSPVGRGIQLNALFDIWDDKSPEEIKDSLLKYIENIRNGGVETGDLLARARLGKYLPSRKVLRDNGRIMMVEVLDEDGNPTGEKEEVDSTSLHYGDGATNPNASPTSDGENACYTNLSGDARGAI